MQHPIPQPPGIEDPALGVLIFTNELSRRLMSRCRRRSWRSSLIVA